MGTVALAFFSVVTTSAVAAGVASANTGTGGVVSTAVGLDAKKALHDSSPTVPVSPETMDATEARDGVATSAASGGTGGGSIRGGLATAVPEPRRKEKPSRGSKRQHVITRIYGKDNAEVRRNVQAVEDRTPGRSGDGLPVDPDHVVGYKDHPFDVARRRRLKEAEAKAKADGTGEEEGARRRRLDGTTADDDGDDDESKFKPLRIRFETGALKDMRIQYPSFAPQIDFIENEILPRTSEFWSKALGVVPVDGNLRISSKQLAGRTHCGDEEFTEVPTEHMSIGLPDTDLVLYASASVTSPSFCGASTLAVAVACNFDQFDRPTAGAINFCLGQIDLKKDGTASEAIIQDNVDVAIHEAAHVLGMSSNSYRYFWDSETGVERTSRPFAQSAVTCVNGRQDTLTLPSENTLKFFLAANGQRFASIVTPKVRAVARNQFNCQSLAGAQLENQPTGARSCTGDHWDERLFYPEALSGVISPTTNVLSHLTLALMEDSGWYKANYTMSRSSPWGKAVGCDFTTEPCLVRDSSNQIVVPDYGRGFFCAQGSKRGCSPAYTHKMACTVIDYSLFFPQRDPDAQFQYFPEQSKGGPRQADYCPVYGSTYSGSEPEDLDCRDPNNADLVNIFGETYGDDSMCFETTTGEGRCYSAQCVKKDLSLRVLVKGGWVTCERDFQTHEISLTGGQTFTCPRIAAACPDMFCPFNCAGRGECVYDANVNGTVGPKCKCFDPKDTTEGCSDSLVPTGSYLDDDTGLFDNLDENFFDPLIAVFVDHPDTWTTGSWAWAAGLFVLFLLMILCICSSFWPQKASSRTKRVPRLH